MLLQLMQSFTIHEKILSTLFMTHKYVSTLLSSFTVLGLLSGCGNSSDVDVQSDGTMDIEVEGGTAKVGTQSMPSNWPEDVPAYPGATVSYSTSVNPQTGTPGMAVMLLTPDTLEAAATYYKTELAAQGWTVESSLEAAGTSLFSATKDQRTASVMINASEGQTAITVAIELGEE
jgi:hypothetical protein